MQEYAHVSEEWKALQRALRRRWLGKDWRPDQIFDRESAIRAFEQHNELVKKSVPPNRLVIWQAEDGWGPLCAALNVNVPRSRFPHANARKAFTQGPFVLPTIPSRINMLATPVDFPRRVRYFDRIRNFSTTHTEATGERQTYWTHFKIALFYSLKMIWYAFCGIIHAFFPEIKRLQFSTSMFLFRAVKFLMTNSERHDDEIGSIFGPEWLELTRKHRPKKDA